MPKTKASTTEGEVSARSTKGEILSAYNEVLAKLHEKQPALTPQAQQQQAAQQQLVSQAAQHSADELLGALSNLKLKTIKQIDGLSEQLLAEFEKLTSLREAISIEQQHLQELYQIKETAHTLSALLQTQAEQKEAFETEMAQSKEAFETEMAQSKEAFETKMTESKASWSEKEAQLTQKYKEQEEALKKARAREEEEYDYTLTQTRRKELDEYEAKKAAAEKALGAKEQEYLEREAALKSKEDRYESLEQEVRQLPDQVQSAVKEAEAALRTRLSQEHKYAREIQEKESTGILQLKEQNIVHLEEKVKRQEETIKRLNEKLDQASGQVQEIACRALDTSSHRFTSPQGSKVEEQSK